MPRTLTAKAYLAAADAAAGNPTVETFRAAEIAAFHLANLYHGLAMISPGAYGSGDYRLAVELNQRYHQYRNARLSVTVAKEQIDEAR
ncbi:hypothetical protein GCM10010178_42540 [Lentzea flava]|uniref:Uncharacterized protein n=2 Tax=Lentzea flava TaxID=103732 RepID=A0ABQ2UN26_9PSEU|nr:hypothetical protein [Lentzea flava]GGU45599.1 hypothetical protein GCM10010178_42540 [Lentzea flava]